MVRQGARSRLLCDQGAGVERMGKSHSSIHIDWIAPVVPAPMGQCFRGRFHRCRRSRKTEVTRSLIGRSMRHHQVLCRHSASRFVLRWIFGSHRGAHWAMSSSSGYVLRELEVPSRPKSQESLLGHSTRLRGFVLATALAGTCPVLHLI